MSENFARCRAWSFKTKYSLSLYPDARSSSSSAPVSQETGRCRPGWLLPDLTQVFLQVVSHRNGPVQVQCFLQSDTLVLRFIEILLFGRRQVLDHCRMTGTRHVRGDSFGLRSGPAQARPEAIYRVPAFSVPHVRIGSDIPVEEP